MNLQIEAITAELSVHSEHLSRVVSERGRLQVICDKAKRLSAQNENTILKLTDEVATAR